MSEDAFYDTSLKHVTVDMTPLLYFEQLEHLWISSHLDIHTYLYIPDTIDPNLTIHAKHLHLTCVFSVNITFFTRFKHLETVDIYDSFLFPQMYQLGTLLES